MPPRVTKSLWEIIKNAIAGTPADDDLLLYAPQPGTDFVTDCKSSTLSALSGAILAGQNVLMASRQITNAEMLALKDTPIQIIAAKPGTILLPVMIAVASDTVAAAYATVADFLLGVAGTLNLWGSISLADSQLDSGAVSFAFSGSNVMGGIVIGGTNVSASGLAVVISADANPTGGNAANIVQVRLWYVEIPEAA